MRKKIEIIKVDGKNYIVVDGEGFDWEVETQQVRKAEVSIKNDPLMKENFVGSIFNHMTSCFSEFIGKKVSLKEINNSIESGYIEV